MANKRLKRQLLLRKLFNKRRLVILNEDTFEETFSLKDKTVNYQARVKFTSGDVKGTAIKKCNLYDSISQEVL